MCTSSGGESAGQPPSSAGQPSPTGMPSSAGQPSPAGMPSSAGQALAMVRAGLGYLAACDAPALGTAGQAEALLALERAEAVHTAARAKILAAFTSGHGHEADAQFGPGPWLRAMTRVTKGAAAGAVGWARRLQAHPAVAAALTREEISASWAREICGWTDRLPAAYREDADRILLAAAAGGADLPGLAGLAEEMLARSRATADEDRDRDRDFDQRQVRLQTTLGGAGHLDGDLTPGCAAALQVVLDALAGRAGPEDDRTVGQRRHDALEEACQRLLAARMVPGRDGQPVHVQAHIDLKDLRAMPAACGLEAAWLAAWAGITGSDGSSSPRATSPDGRGGLFPHGPGGRSPDGSGGGAPDGAGGLPGWLAGGPGWSPARAAVTPGTYYATGPEAEAAACDATVTPVLTGHLDWRIAGQLTACYLDAHGYPHQPAAQDSGTGDSQDGEEATARPCQDHGGQEHGGQEHGGQDHGGPAGRTSPACGCSFGTCPGPAGPHRPLSPQGWARLQRTLTRMAIDLVSGPGGIASLLRTRLAGPPMTSPSLPLDIGAATPVIPPHLRKAVITRDQHCQFPGCAQPPAVCQIHHVLPRSAGGPAALHNLKLLCRFHHLIVIHRWGWTLTCHPDGTTTATAPGGRTLHSHSPPGRAG